MNTGTQKAWADSRYVCPFFPSDFVKIERDEITGQKPKNISNLEPNKDWDQTNR